jgi:hypothetical protein
VVELRKAVARTLRPLLRPPIVVMVLNVQFPLEWVMAQIEKRLDVEVGLRA